MSTFMAKQENVQRKWYVLDATDKPVGRIAATAAAILRGKHKVEFTPNVDGGDYVVIVNAEKAVLTGKKLEQKYHYTHSGYAGGLKATQYKTIMSQKPELAIKLAIKGMLPKNGIGRKSLDRVKIYAGSEHKQQAQKPEPWTAE